MVVQIGGDAQAKLQLQIYVSVLAASEYADAGTRKSGNVHVYHCTGVTSNYASAPACCCESPGHVQLPTCTSNVENATSRLRLLSCAVTSRADVAACASARWHRNEFTACCH